MKSSADSQVQAPTSLLGTLILRLIVPGRLPSWNALLGMSHWQRLKEKKRHQREFISALSLSENASSIPIICARSGTLILSDIAELFKETSRTKSPSKRRKGKRVKARKSTR